MFVGMNCLSLTCSRMRNLNGVFKHMSLRSVAAVAMIVYFIPDQHIKKKWEGKCMLPMRHKVMLVDGSMERCLGS